jgi:hypothetical protein
LVGRYRKVSKRYNLKKKRSKIFLQGAPSSSYSPHMTQLPGENASHTIQNSSLANPTLRNKHICKRANQKENSIDVPTTTASQFYYN